MGNVIPNQRIERLTKYVRVLEKKIEDLEKEQLVEKLKNEECVDFLEESFVHASRAITQERIEYIANVVRNGLDEKLIEYTESKYLLKLLQELNEQEIIWLRFYLIPTIGGDTEFREKHKNILDSIQPHLGSDQDTIDKAAFQKNYKNHLERLGLISSNYQIDRNTKQPIYDKFTGKPKTAYSRTTTLGNLLLKQIGLYPEENKG